MPTLISYSRKVEETLAKFLIPHHRNKHHPYLIRHMSIFALTGFILVLQMFFNIRAGKMQVLGFATSIFKNEIITLTNQERQNNSSSQLAENSLLDQAAASKAAYMFSKNYWAHYAPDGTSPWYFFNQAGYKYIWAGENLARDFQTSEGVVQGWLNSPSHRENLLNKSYQDIGVAVLNGVMEGEKTTLVVQLFGTQPTPAKAAPLAQSPPPANPKTVNDQLVLDTKKNTQSSAPAVQAQTKVSSEYATNLNLLGRLHNLTFGAKLELFLLISLVMIFIVDSIIVARKGVERGGSHSLVHALVLVILIISIIAGSSGKLI